MAALFTPLNLRSLELANRIVVSPMAQYSARDGCAGEWHQMHLGGFAVSGAALVIIEATAVNPEGRISLSDLGLWNDENMHALETIARFFQQYGTARLGLQLFHAGRKGSTSTAWDGHRPLGREAGGWTLSSPSSLPYPNRPDPVALGKTELARVRNDFVKAAARADRAGIDLLELHVAHGYLLHSFLSPLSNDRRDEYGGSRDNRMRFVLEVFEAMREMWPSEKPMGARISVTDAIPGGWDVDDSVVLAQKLRALGCDYITASSGGLSPEQKINVFPGYQVPFAKRIREEARIPTTAVGLITEARQAEEIIGSRSADLVALGRGMLFNPRWPWHAAIELGAECMYPRQYERAHPSMRGDFFKTTQSA